MAKAQLEIQIYDTGAPPVGATPGPPAPTGPTPTPPTQQNQSQPQPPTTSPSQPPPLPTPPAPPKPPVPPKPPSVSSAVSQLVKQLGSMLTGGPGALLSGAGGLLQSAGGVASAVGATGAGAAMAAIAGPIAAVGASLALVVHLLSKQVDALAQYSGAISAATARSEIRDMKAEMNRAEALGPMLARFEDARSRMANKFYDLMTQIIDILLRVFGPALTRIITLIETACESLTFIINVLTLKWGDAWEQVKQKVSDAWEQVKGWFGSKDAEDSDMFFDQLLAQLPAGAVI